MGSFEEDKDIIKQNLECVTERPDAVFGIRMLMEDKCEMPDREMVQDVMEKLDDGAETVVDQVRRNIRPKNPKNGE